MPGIQSDTPTLALPRVAHRHVEVDGLRIFYREAEAPDGAPTLLLLHGFPSASHQFRRLIDALGGRFRLIAPDYPGFGHSDAPASSTAGGSFEYSFDALADVVEGFCHSLELDRFALYAFNFGAPVGFRLATRHPDWIAGLVIQNANAYEARQPAPDSARRGRADRTLPRAGRRSPDHRRAGGEPHHRGRLRRGDRGRARGRHLRRRALHGGVLIDE